MVLNHAITTGHGNQKISLLTLLQVKNIIYKLQLKTFQEKCEMKVKSIKESGYPIILIDPNQSFTAV